MHLLKSDVIFRSRFEGSPSRTKRTILPTWTMSYFPIRCSGMGPFASSMFKRTFCGSHCFGGKCADEISNPSNWAVGETDRERSTSHMLSIRLINISEDHIQNQREIIPCSTCDICYFQIFVIQWYSRMNKEPRLIRAHPMLKI